MAQVNVNRKVSDPFYRYKMPSVIVKVEGRGNGIKTVISNMVEIAKALNTPPSYPTKYMGIELGAQVYMDEENEKYIVNGAHDNKKLQNMVYEFIEKFLLCPQCNNPETELIVSNGKEKIKVACAACGYRNYISHSHRLNTYILKNPPKYNSKYNSKKNGDSNTNQKASNEIDVSIPQISGNSDIKEVEWMTDTSEAAMALRMKNLSLKAAELTVNEDLDKTIGDRLEIFHNFIHDRIYDLSEDNIAKIVHESKRLDLSEKAIFAVCDLIFTDKEVLKTIQKYKDLINEINCGDPKAQMNVLHAIEITVVKYPELNQPKILNNIFKILYELDMVDEKAFLMWSQNQTSRYLNDDKKLVEKVHKNSELFINWLKTAESESDTSDTGVEFTNGNKGATVTDDDIIKSPTRLTLPKGNDDYSDLNIDEI